MPLKPAAREGDDHWCPISVPEEHEGGPILPPCHPLELVDGKAQARATDRAKCNGPSDLIVTGSALVFVGGQMATREGEKTMHSGKIRPPCSPTKSIGGPSAGIILGKPDDAKKACKALKNGRDSKQLYQSNNNCGVESSRMVINTATDANINEADLLKMAEKNGWSSEGGMTMPWNVKDILNGNDVQASSSHQSFSGIEQALADGKAVITLHWAGRLWKSFTLGMHYVNTTGIKYNAKGTAEKVFFADTGTGECMSEVSAARYWWSMPSWGQMTTTDAPIDWSRAP